VNNVTHKLYLPAGSAAGDAAGDAVVITPERAGWTWSGLRVLELVPGEARTLTTATTELAVLPLAGACVVECEGRRFDLHGREHVFAGVSDFAYLPIDAEARLSSVHGGRFALPSAAATRRLDPAYGPAHGVPVELRGAGQASRQVNNFLEPSAFPADKLVAVEVLTPEGNWSSYPPHKHDECRLPEEAQLEEIYYFEVARTGHAPSRDGFGLHRLYTTDGEIDLAEEVRSGDAVLIPRGYHGPSVAAPGYDLYYLNVLAGPAEQRTMAFCDDPAHTWVRGTWANQQVDPRLPMTTAQVRE
jgi:5-deoxy-glucuronate isomerase